MNPPLQQSLRLTLISLMLLVLAVDLGLAKKDNIKKIIKQINEGDYTWKAAENHVTAMGDKAKVLAGSRLSSAKGLPLKQKPNVDHETIPTSFDTREEWNSCQSIWSIKDQGSCGTCWAVSTASVMSDRLCIASAGSTQVNISAEHLASCCVDCGMGCNGGYPEKAWPFFLEHGLVTGGDYKSSEGCQPYAVAPSNHSAVDNSSYQYLVCHPKTCTNKKYTTPFKDDFHYGETAYSLPNDVTSIQAEIMTNGPVVAGFNVYADFKAYSSGVYQYVTGELLGGHAVRVLGWGVENNTEYWLVANSWNRNWGENGYFKILRGVNECGIEVYIFAGLVESD